MATRANFTEHDFRNCPFHEVNVHFSNLYLLLTQLNQSSALKILMKSWPTFKFTMNLLLEVGDFLWENQVRQTHFRLF